MDIKSGNTYPSCALSNFASHPFVLDGVECASAEGWLQSLKFDKPHIQVEVCKLSGYVAKLRGRARTKHWQRVQKLWWQGVEYDRHGDAYQELLDRAYEALAQNDGFRRALLATNNAVLRHSMGRSNASETILTTTEFTSRLTKIRERLKNGNL